jgi:hypothetical protein
MLRQTDDDRRKDIFSPYIYDRPFPAKIRRRTLANPVRNIILIAVDWAGSMSNIRALAATPFPKS